MRPPSPSIPEREFTFSALKQSLRLDGRQLLEMRKPTFRFGSELGWVECALGKTRVLAQVDATMTKPIPERPFEGIISIHSEFSPMASTQYEAVGRPSEEEIVITRMLDKIIRRCDSIDKESLCILAAQRVWHLRITVHFLADAGNLLDCACLAAMVALKHFRRPEVEVVGEEVIVHSPLLRAPVPLGIHHTPFCLSFALFPDPEVPSVLDPSQLESSLCDGVVSLALNAQKELCVVQKAGGVPLAPQDFLHLVAIGVERVKQLDTIVEEALANDFTDHLGWFKDHEATQGGKFRTIEDLMRAKGEKVQRGKIGEGGVIEYNGDE
ncbi:hypothetical protein Clacol_005430 [Clathrus columnatus]|uniref:Exosome complex component RRP45 n=1 Tax=Clathrus columnatus TaxID=1419009 RepID=A0AAV5ADK5_9AGAM|nr:hypothetical protein Clacol_005430 [Clathrus columnatus]